ncbi:hypothetical protein ES702_06601 [subsurface metagenome]
MKITIEGQKVTLKDDTGMILIITINQLLEMVSVLNSAILDGDRFYFETLEFTV